MAASAQLPGWLTRGTGLASTSERHASPAMAVQPFGTAAQPGGSSRRRLLPCRVAGYEGRQAAPMTPRPYSVQPGSLRNRQPSGAAPLSAQLLQQQQLAAAVALQQQQLQQQQQQQHVMPPLPLGPAHQPPLPGASAAGGVEPPSPTTAGSGGSSQLSDLEVQRRQKISQANKGRTPWNKGRKHPPEVIARIKAATAAAMKRPEVRERLAKANEKREPHSDEAKEKIRVKLLERANHAREEINAQATLIVQRMAASEDPAEQECASYDKAVETVAGLAWQYFKKDWEDVATRGWEEHPEFRRRCISKLQGLLAKKRAAAAPKKRKVDKVKAALSHMKKLGEAREKLAQAEDAVTKLQRAKVAFAGDPARLKAVYQAEEKATQLLTKLRQQVAKLEIALEPLRQHLDAPQAGEEQEQPGLEEQEEEEQQQWQPEQQQWQQQEQEQQHGAGVQPVVAANGVAVNGHVNGHAHLNGATAAVAASSNGAVGAARLNGAAPHAVNGHAVSAAAAAAAAPSRSALPWQQ